MIDDQARIRGVITAGNLTRAMEHADDVFKARVESVMTSDARVARADELGSAVVFRMETHGIMAMPVIDDDERVVGVVHLHDLMRAGAA